MSRRTVLAPKEYYHLYNRGTEKRNIFTNQKDRERFLALLYLSNNTKAIHLSNYPNATLPKLFAIGRSAPLVDIGSYCLMPNHFHLLVREHNEGGISRFMQKLITGYTMYFNTRYERSGALFQGKYKARHVGEDRYFQYLIAYIHLNPVKLLDPKWKENGIKDRKKAEKFLQSYSYSSYLDYCGEERPEGCIVNPASFPSQFETPKGFRDSVTEWLGYRPG